MDHNRSMLVLTKRRHTHQAKRGIMVIMNASDNESNMSDNESLSAGKRLNDDGLLEADGVVKH